MIGNAVISVLTADAALMRAYAGLVSDEGLRQRILNTILDEFSTTRGDIEALFGDTLENQRPVMACTVQLRTVGLRPLHHQQIRLMRVWRLTRRDGDDVTATETHSRLQLIVNAIASGLGTTG